MATQIQKFTLLHFVYACVKPTVTYTLHVQYILVKCSKFLWLLLDGKIDLSQQESEVV